MDIKASVDIGNNMKELIEKFANSIGTTAKEIYPYYVKQSVISGWSWLAILLSIVAVCGITIFITNKMTHRKIEPLDDEVGTGIIIVCLIGAIVTLIGLGLGFSDIVTMIANPEYHAIHDLIADVSKFTGR